MTTAVIVDVDTNIGGEIDDFDDDDDGQDDETNVDIHVDLKEIPFLGEKSERFMRSLSAIDAVGTRPVGFRRIESVRNVVRALRETPHSAFPVMGPDGLGSPCLLGSVLRSYLLVMLRHKADFFSPEERDLRPGRLPGGAGRREQ